MVASGLSIPDIGQDDAQRCTTLYAKLGLSPAQTREMMTNTGLAFNYDKSLHALRVLHPVENRVIEPSLVPVRDLGRGGGGG